jgi:hypothetical protein
MQPVQLSGTSRKALVIRVPKSWNAPHAVLQRQSRLIYARNSAGAHAASVDEMRTMFLAGATFLDRAHEFQRRRLAEIHGDQGPFSNFLGEGGRLVFRNGIIESAAGDVRIQAGDHTSYFRQPTSKI